MKHRCSICKQVKSWDEFYRRSDGNPDSYCKSCRKQKSKDSYHKVFAESSADTHETVASCLN